MASRTCSAESAPKSLQTAGFSIVSGEFDFHGVQREITKTWAPNGHPSMTRWLRGVIQNLDAAITDGPRLTRWLLTAGPGAYGPARNDGFRGAATSPHGRLRTVISRRNEDLAAFGVWVRRGRMLLATGSSAIYGACRGLIRWPTAKSLTAPPAAPRAPDGGCGGSPRSRRSRALQRGRSGHGIRRRSRRSRADPRCRALPSTPARWPAPRAFGV